MIGEGCAELVLLEDFEGDEVDEGGEDGLEGRAGTGYAFGLGAEEADDLDAVTRAHAVDVVVIAQNVHRRRRLPLRHILRQLLYLNILLIRKVTEPMHNLKRPLQLTTHTLLRFSNLGIDQINRHLSLALQTLKHCRFHLWIDLATTNDNTTKTD